MGRRPGPGAQGQGTCPAVGIRTARSIGSNSKTIKYRKSEVGPVHPTAPRLIPALNLSRVRSLLTGRAHSSSAEFWWKFDSVTGESFAVILHYAAEAGHDVFGLSPQGTAWVAREATKRWRAWIAGGGGIRATQEVPDAKVSRKPAFRQPVRKIEVKQPISKVDLSRYDLKAGEKSLIEKAIAAGRFQGFCAVTYPASSGSRTHDHPRPLRSHPRL